ncbi:MAG: hypothetical protein ABI651_15785, partial [Verrucomicrobiota bacterium]
MKHKVVLPNTLAGFWMPIQPLMAATPPLSIEKLPIRNDGRISRELPRDGVHHQMLMSLRMLLPVLLLIATACSLVAQTTLDVTLLPDLIVRISWPASTGSTALESSPALAPIANWQPVSAPATLANGRYTVDLEADDQYRFFRLRGVDVAPQGLPRLAISVLPDQIVRLAWPASIGNAVLESSPALGVTAVWQPVNRIPVRANGVYAVNFEADDRYRFFRLRLAAASLATVSEISPAAGESGVAVTRETIFRLSAPLAASTIIGPNALFAGFGGRRLLSRAELSSDRRTLTLFYLENLPASAQVNVVFDGTGLADESGQPFDADGDGEPGGTHVLQFSTAGTSGLENTAVIGHVFASELGAAGTNRPLEGAIVTVDGAEESLRAVTDATGSFTLQPAPAGRFFVHVDGRTAAGSQWPSGAYYPFVGKAWEAVAGKTNNLASGTGEIFLPLIQADALQAVSATEETKITFVPSVLAANPALAGVEVRVPPNTLFSENGARGGKVGIAPVPPDRLPEPLPPGLNLPLVITIQTDGPQNFDRPVPVRFPNLPDPVTGVKLGPGEKTVLWSFNHDTGRWEAQGTATITADGNFAETDPGVGVRQPGWHGVAPGSPGSGPGQCEDTDPNCPCLRTIDCTPRGGSIGSCPLKCLGDVMDDLFGEGEKPKRTAFENGLRCIGGPDKCDGKPEDTLNKERRDCMDQCLNPDKRIYILPCEGFVHPCPQLATLATLPSGLLPDRFEEQKRFWEVEGEFLVRLTATPKILENTAVDVPKIIELFDALADRVQPAGPSGVHLSATERAELVALPRPAQFSQAEWTAMIDRLDSLQGNPVPPDVAEADQQLNELVTELKRRGWKYRLDGLVLGFVRQSQVQAPVFGSEQFPARPHYFSLKHHQTGFVQRGRLNGAGRLNGIVLSPNGLYTVAYFDPVTQWSGSAFFEASSVGVATVMPTAPLIPLAENEPDTDSDGLPDTIETLLGTNPNSIDTDGDGVPDGAEIQLDTNPLDGIAAQLGLISSTQLPLAPIRVRAENNIAVLMDAKTNLMVLDIEDPLQPVMLSRASVTATFGFTGRLALTWPYALAVTDSSTTLFDLSDPTNPVQKWTRNESATAGAIVFGRVYISNDQSVFAFDLESGEPVPTITGVLGQNSNLRVLEDQLIATYGTTLEIFKLSEGGNRLQSIGRVQGKPWHGLFVEPGYAYTGWSLGYLVINIGAPANPVIVAQSGTRPIFADEITKDSGNRLISITRSGLNVPANLASVYDQSSPTVATNFLTSLATSSSPFDVFIYRGRLLSAGYGLSAGVFEVFNYREPDFGTNPPSIQLRSYTFFNNPAIEQSAGWFRLTALAQDDVVVRNVEFYLDGNLAFDDGSHPFEADLRAPVFTAQKSSFTVRARALDLGGNAT